MKGLVHILGFVRRGARHVAGVDDQVIDLLQEGDRVGAGIQGLEPAFCWLRQGAGKTEASERGASGIVDALDG